MRELAQKTDTALYEMYLRRSDAKNELDRAEDWLRYLYDARWNSTTQTFKRHWDEVLSERRLGTNLDNWEKFDEAVETLKAIKIEIRAVEKIYEEHCWSRFYLVPAGHIHRTTDCHSCYSNTQFLWLPELSGLTDADAVEAEGEILCTFCFPAAPVAWTEGVGRRTIEVRTEAQRAKEERMRVKAEKSLSVDGTEVVIRAIGDDIKRFSMRKTFKTYRAAEIWMTEALTYRTLQMLFPEGTWIGYAPDAYTSENCESVLALMALKKDVPLGEILDGFKKKVQKKVSVEREWIDSLIARRG